MANNDNTIIKIAEVKSVIDDADGMRIKVRLVPEDNSISLDKNLPYAFPLLPKQIHVSPKVGECVFVILANQGESEGNRYYIGPIISQPQMLNKDNYSNLSAVSLLKGNEVVSPLEAPSVNPEINGSLPEYEDIAIQGRQNTDIILKNNEMRIRCGMRNNPLLPQPENLFFNKQNPAYIQMKYMKNKVKYNNNSSYNTYGSVINVVADRINLLTHDSESSYTLTDENELIPEDVLNDIMNNGHPFVYGDRLINFLTKLLNVVATHTHPFPNDPPYNDVKMTDVTTTNLNTLLSKTIKTN